MPPMPLRRSQRSTATLCPWQRTTTSSDEWKKAEFRKDNRHHHQEQEPQTRPRMCTTLMRQMSSPSSTHVSWDLDSDPCQPEPPAVMELAEHVEGWQMSLSAGLAAIRYRLRKAGDPIGGPPTDARWDMSLVEVHDWVGESTMHSVHYIAWTWPGRLRGRRAPHQGRTILCVVPAAAQEETFNEGGLAITVLVPGIGLKPHRKPTAQAPEVDPEIHQVRLMAEALQQRQFESADHHLQLETCQLCGEAGKGEATSTVTTCPLCLGSWHPECAKVVAEFLREGCATGGMRIKAACAEDLPPVPSQVMEYACRMCSQWQMICMPEIM